MGFRNLPQDNAAQLADLITVRAGQVSSMALTRIGDPIGATLLAFAEGENVSEEAYPGDALYYLVEGEAQINGHAMVAGDVLMVPGGTLHAVNPAGAAKLLQIIFS